MRVAGGAVARVVAAKEDGQQPLPILLPNVAYLQQHGMDSPLAVLAEQFWPGALTLVVPFPGLPAQVTAGKYGRCGGICSSVVRSLVECLGEPLVATSANLGDLPRYPRMMC